MLRMLCLLVGTCRDLVRCLQVGGERTPFTAPETHVQRVLARGQVWTIPGSTQVQWPLPLRGSG